MKAQMFNYQNWLDETNPFELRKKYDSQLKESGFGVLSFVEYNFEPQGCTVVIALAESHVSCHTWPENGCLAVDVYTCGDGNPRLIALEILKYLNSDNYSLREVDR